MNIIVVGGGGREHAIIRKLKENADINTIYCAPGNAGIANSAVCIDIKATDIDAVISFSVKNNINFAVIGPDDPLALGAADAFEAVGIPVFGPSKNAAIIEYSKAYSKDLMRRYNIPTAGYEIFDNYDNAVSYIKTAAHPLVIKADGLALGKGVIISDNTALSEKALYEMMKGGKFGKSGSVVVIEEKLEGSEVTVLAFCDGKTIKPMISSQDHKRAYDGDKGLNTGGMGAFAPSIFYNEETAAECMRKIINPTVEALIQEGRPYKGVLYFGLMLTDNGPKVIEYNSRFGDPEAQAILPLLETDLFTIMRACAEGRLDGIDIKWSNRASCCVVLASGGYPAAYETGYPINGIEGIDNGRDIYVFHSGTSAKNGKIVTNGGRVLGITATGGDLSEAVSKAYENVNKVTFEAMHYRKDIGKKAAI